MSRLFNVTLDYLLNEENSRRDQDSAPSRAEEEKGFYVSLETARGFLACQKVRYRKISLAVFLFIASLAFCFMQAETGILIFMILIIAGAVLLFSVKLNDYPYRRLWSEPLLFDKNILSELTVEYTNYRKRAHAGILTGIALIGIGILFLPLLLPAEQELWDSVVLGAGMVLAGAGSFLCIYQTGMVKSYRLLIRNTNQF